ncbi:hypothetical protein OK016_27240 [Vibrio chagasii]|nr:hypothetical protein [Vibrio chagasii]
MVKAQTIMAEELRSPRSTNELRKAIFSQPALDHKDSRLFASVIVATERKKLECWQTFILIMILKRVIPYHQHCLQNAKRTAHWPTKALSQNLLDQAIANRMSYEQVKLRG